jgi:hypothetical protein
MQCKGLLKRIGPNHVKDQLIFRLRPAIVIPNPEEGLDGVPVKSRSALPIAFLIMVNRLPMPQSRFRRVRIYYANLLCYYYT